MTFSTAQAAALIGRTPRSLRRWEQVGLIPAVAQVNGQRRYTPADIDRLKQVANMTAERQRHHEPAHAPVDLPARPLPPGLARHRSAKPQPNPRLPIDQPDDLVAITTAPPPWASPAQPEPKPTPWARLNGDVETESKLRELPVTCNTCWRKLVVHGTHLPSGERILLASCSVHGEQARSPWM